MSIDADFIQFHQTHPKVYAEFVRRAREIKARGLTHYSADVILAIVRWHTDITGRDVEPFKINNNYSSRYARMLMREYPAEFAGFFSTRVLRSAG